MRPILIHIPIQWLVRNILVITLLLTALLIAYIVWSWIIKKKDFPVDAAFFLGIIFFGGLGLYFKKDTMNIPSSIPIYSYGFMMMIGFAGGIFLAVYRAPKYNIHPDIIYDLSMYVILAGVFGARFFYFFIESPGEFKGQPWWNVFKIWQGGLTFYGGFIGASIAVITYIYIKKIDALKLIDLLSPSTMVGLGFGRIGCFLNGCCWGKPATADTWLPTWTWPKGTYCYLQQLGKGLITKDAAHSLPVYLTQLSSSFLAFALAGFLLLFAKYFQKRKGTVFGLLLILYSIERYMV
ncbi:MAG: prolipoprotein diacylglyceryl transferase, partial [Planctomycetota bacterium]